LNLAVLAFVIAATPLTTLDQLLDFDRHSRREEFGFFIDDHRLDIAVAGTTTLLVAAVVVVVVAIPSAAG